VFALVIVLVADADADEVALDADAAFLGAAAFKVALVVEEEDAEITDLLAIEFTVAFAFAFVFLMRLATLEMNRTDIIVRYSMLIAYLVWCDMVIVCGMVLLLLL
jgi:hypothetical protein